MSTGSVVISARRSDDITRLDLRISHPMEPGTRKDKQGTLIPAWYLTQLQIYHEDAPVAKLELGPLVSRNPAVSMQLKKTNAGELIKVIWEDNRGKRGEHSARIVD